MNEIAVRGGATAEELAGVLAALAARRPAPESSGTRGTGSTGGYVAWRRGRLRALSASFPGREITTR